MSVRTRILVGLVAFAAAATAALPAASVVELEAAKPSVARLVTPLPPLLDLPPAPKLDLFGLLDPAMATASELRGQSIFFDKGRCAACHAPPFYTDDRIHDLKVERRVITVNGRSASTDGPIRTFSLRGIKDSAPYLHDGRLLTLEDSVQYFDRVLGTKLSAQEMQDLVAFLQVL